MSRQVFIVAGMASKGANLAPLSLLGELHRGEDVHYIDGAEVTDRGLCVTPPSRQAQAIKEILSKSSTRKSLIYTHSIGALAAILHLESDPHNSTKVVAISPPLPDPVELLSHPRITARMREVNGQTVIPSYSFALGNRGPSSITPDPVDIRITDTYVEDVVNSSVDFLGRVKRLSTAGMLKLVLPTEDWNSGVEEAVLGLNNVLHIEATHSLQASQEAMASRALEIYEFSTPMRLVA